MFVEISHNSQENTCVRVSFLTTLLRKRLWHRCFSVNCVEFLRTPFSRNTSVRLILEYADYFIWCFSLFKTFQSQKMYCLESCITEQTKKVLYICKKWRLSFVWNNIFAINAYWKKRNYHRNVRLFATSWQWYVISKKLT